MTTIPGQTGRGGLTGGRRQTLIRGASTVVRYELVTLAGVAAALTFAGHLPPWIVALAMLAVPIMWVCRRLSLGYFVAATPLNFAILLMLFMMLPALYASAIMELSLLGVYRVVATVGLFYGLVSFARTWERVQTLVMLLLAGGALLALAALLDTRFSESKVLPLGRIYDLLPHVSLPIMAEAGANANISGGILAMLVPVGLALLIFPGTPRKLKWVAWPATLLAALTVLLSQSRGAWLGLAGAVLLLLVLRDRRFFLVVVAAMAGAAFYVHQVGTAFVADLLLQSSTIPGAAGRIEIWQRAIYMLQDFSFTGVGLGTFGRVAALLYPFFLISPASVVPHPHNIYLQAGVDFGIPGLVAFVALLAGFLLLQIEVLGNKTNLFARALAAGFLGSMTVYMTHGMVDSITNFIKASLVLWSILALGVAVWALARDARSPSS